METNISAGEVYALLYLHDWDASGKIYPEISGLYKSWQSAETDRKMKSEPDKYYIRKAYLKE